MFDFFRKHTRILQFLLVLLIFPAFVLVGIDGYTRFRDGANAAIAKVDGHAVTQAEWDVAQRDQIERVRRQNPTADVRQLDTPEMRRNALEIIVRDRVMAAAANDLHLSVSDERLGEAFKNDPQLAAIRTPDGRINKDLLAMQGMSVGMFEQRLRQDLSVRLVLQGIGLSSLTPDSVVTAALDPLFQQREVQLQRFEARNYEAKVTPTDADIDKYYRDHAAQFRLPEQATVSYVVLDLAAIKKTVTVPEAELRKNYEENAARYTTAEQRRASHILIKAEKDAPKAERDKARARAEALLAELKKNPAGFAELAKKNSQDPGSAQNGGDLDFFARGAMVKPFEDSAFSLKPGETSGVVESDFGYHIIKLTDLRGGEKRSFDAVKPELEDEVRTKLAQQKYSEAAADFTNLVFEQSDSLKPAADRYKLTVQSAKGVTRTVTGDASGPLDNAKLREALFGSDSISKKRNTEAVETGPSRLVSARIDDYQPARQLPLAEVKEAVRKSVVAEQAAALARKEGEARVADLKKAPQTALAEPAITVSRNQTQNLPRAVIDAALRADASKLPTATGADLGSAGYVALRIVKLVARDPAVTDAPAVRSQLGQAWTEAELAAYYEALKKRFKVEIKTPAAAASAPAI